MPRLTPIHGRKLVKILEAEGAVIVGQTGDHIELKKEGAKRRLVVPKYRDIPIFIPSKKPGIHAGDEKF